MGDTGWDNDELLENTNRDDVMMEQYSDSDITELSPKLQRFIHLYMTGQYTHQKLSQLLDVHPNTISNWLKRNDVQSVISDMQKTTHQIVGIQIKALSNKAVMKLGNLIDSPIDGVALQAVKDVLDRSNHKAAQKINVDKRVITFEEKLTRLIDETIDEDMIEVEYEDNE